MPTYKCALLLFSNLSHMSTTTPKIYNGSCFFAYTNCNKLFNCDRQFKLADFFKCIMHLHPLSGAVGNY